MNLIKRPNTLPVKFGSRARSRALGAVMMGTTALVNPSPAYAMPPVVAAVTAITGAITAAFTAIGTAIGLSATAAAAFGAFATKVVIGLALNALARALTPKPKIPEPSERMVNFAQPITYMETVYGKTRKGGPIGYTNFGNKRRDYVVILAAHEIDGYEQHWLDEWPVTIDSSGVVQTSPPGSLARIYNRYGTNPQATLPIVDKYGELTSSHDFAGLAVTHVVARKPKAEDFTKNYPRGREWAYTPVIRGKNNIYDPRDGAYKYTNNAALVIADWITTIMEREVDWDKVAVEADVADEEVPQKGGGTQRRWTLNGVVSDEEEDDVTRAQLGASCDSFFYETPEGEVGFRLGRYEEPTITLTEDDFYSMTASEGAQPQEAPTEIVINYVEPNNAYREAPSGAWIIDPEARRIREELSAYFVDNHNQAVRVAKRLARVRYAQYRINGVLKYVGNRIITQRFVRVVHSQLGIDATFEVDKLVRNEDGLAYEVNLISVDPEDFAFDPDLEEPDQPAYGDVTPIIDDDRPTNITATSKSIGGSPGLEINWTAANEILAHRVRWAEKDTEDWSYSEILSAGTTSYEIAPLDDQETYDIQVQAVSGVSGAPFSTHEPVPPLEATPVLNTDPPDPLQSFSVAVSGTDVTITIETPNDPNYYATRIYRNTTSSFAGAVVIRTEYGAANVQDSYTDPSLSPGTYYYWGEPINGSGIAGAVSGPEQADIV